MFLVLLLVAPVFLAACGEGETGEDADVDVTTDLPLDADGAAEADPGADPAGDGMNDTDAPPDTGIDTVEDSGDGDAATDAVQLGTITGTIRTDHFGWRPADPKFAVLLNLAGAAVEVRSLADNSVAAAFTSGGMGTDEDSGDPYSVVDFSSLATPGNYYLYLPASDERSYDFGIREDVYAIVGSAAMKSFYYQRCNHARELPYASDALGSFPGIGGRWVDGTCHGQDFSAPAGPGSPDHGPLDVHGGWHDAGDYQKTLWSRGVGQMLWAYELNPSAWSDGQLGIPESGNSIPDILDELKWELDFYVRMQRPDGHFMTSAKGHNASTVSPPSASDEERVYFDTTSPSGGGWSGGGVTITEATGNAVLALAHAAIVFGSIGQTAIAGGFQDAALSGWAWLDAHLPGGGRERQIACAAASAVYRMDIGQTSARDLVESFPWADWDGMLPWSVTPNDVYLTQAAWHYLSNPDGNGAKKAEIGGAAAQAVVGRAFDQEGAYGGLFGDSSNGWDWSWGSNANQSMYGANLMAAARFGILGGYSEAQVTALAQKYLHYILGLNPLGMVYLTNMAAYGGEHSSFQIYHGWFSYTGGDGDHGNAGYNGKPASVTEPLYPYYADDDQTSTYGPAPGIMPGGPNWYYGGSYEIPNRGYPAYAYRDWSVGCDWDGSQCLSASWEITEPMCAYQGPFVLLVSFFM
jgi:endoglucanase